ncbi:MAG TPA: DUF4406 domain-containing protein [Flavipsychrobacter sp.]|nr:DUF4406 domain-containing protein [Flavipsychrobacter sp.]
MSKTIYIGGQVSGLPREQVKDKFNRVASELSAQGYNVVSPVSITQRSKSWEEAIRSDIKNMLECDEVHLLPCWQESRGARLERDIALRLGMQIVYH